ncbi:hypothetical protein EDD15DRAFT_2367786 [Pisolithus albus]|nr:hypothetical protein EDD15DRAFT_2203420 [Pisolithus albus]KAI5992989.1 hypothetical protein EDD15DRAFT_2367786 [Pisolithus albus]
MSLAVHQGDDLSDDDLGPDIATSDSRGSDSSDDSNDLDEMRNVLQVPGPSAEAHELRKALAIAQKAYADARTELRSVRKELAVLSSALPARKRNRVLNRTETLDSSIAKEAKKYVMLYHFWVTDRVFPTTFKPNVDPRSPSRWSSPEAKIEGMVAELYNLIPKSLHESMEQYPRFGSVFTSALGQERSNILKAIKDSASLIFAQYNLDPSVLSTQDPSKQTDPRFRSLLMKDDKYTRLAPILFKNHEALVPDGFLKSPIIISIIRVLVFGKASLSNQKRGRPKARGQRLGLTSATEGLVAGAAILARFLLSADPELGAVGAVTGIPYRDDFDFYLQRLFKRSTWAIDVMDNVNREVFGTKSKLSISEDLPDVVSNPPARTWEDDFLDEMEDDTVASASMPSTSAMNLSRPPSHPLVSTPSTPPSPLSDDTVSAVAQLQVEVGQLSVSNTRATLPESASASGHLNPRSRRISPHPADPPKSTSADPVQPEPTKRTTRGRSTKSKGKK